MAGNTKVIISNSGQEFTLPGTHWTADQVTATFGDSVPGIASMTSERTVENGDTVYTYRPRTGTKG
jgi:hypothetical protein